MGTIPSASSRGGRAGSSRGERTWRSSPTSTTTGRATRWPTGAGCRGGSEREGKKRDRRAPPRGPAQGLRARGRRRAPRELPAPPRSARRAAQGGKGARDSSGLCERRGRQVGRGSGGTRARRRRAGQGRRSRGRGRARGRGADRPEGGLLGLRGDGSRRAASCAWRRQGVGGGGGDRDVRLPDGARRP